MQVRTAAHNGDFSDILEEDVEVALKEAAEVSMGTEIAEEDIDNIKQLCDQVINIAQYRASLFEYLRHRMNAIAPNLTVMVGELVGARLIAHAGSLLNLAKQPASTVQILGAEKALFRALKTKCFPADDHEILTAEGFMNLAAVEKHFVSHSTLAIACYVKGGLEYHSIARDRVVVGHGDHDLVRFEATVRDVGGKSGSVRACSNAVSLLATDNHAMWVRMGRTVANRCWPAFRGASQALSAPDFRLIDAADVAAASSHDPTTVVQMTAQFERGLNTADPSPAAFEPAAALSLVTEDHVMAFLTLYGYWLGDGWLDGTKASVALGPVKERDFPYLDALFARLPLPRLSSATRGARGYWRADAVNGNGQLQYHIVDPNWWQLFGGQYGHKYAGKFAADAALAAATAEGRAVPTGRPGRQTAPAPLTRRFGTSALRLLDQALGRVREPIEPILPPDLCRVRQSFPEPVSTADDLRRIAIMLAEQLCEKLRRRDQGASRLDLVFSRVVRMAAGRHVVLLNSDTLVAPGWLHTLRAAACSAPDIGTATPLSNEASIFSYPDAAGGNPAPDAEGTRVLASLAAEVNSYRVVDVPTAHGFCMFIRRDCLDATGLLDDISFAQGYGEENDFCERAASLGFRHVAVPSVYVAHVGGVSFGSARTQLLRRNLALLHRRYPSYAARVADFMTADLLAPARRRLDAARWSRRIQGNDAQRNTVLLVTHGGGGGTTRVVGERASALQAQGLRPVVLRAVEGRCEVGDAEGGYPNLVYALPAEIGPLRRLLAADRPVSAELHHLLGHDHSVLRLFAALRIPYDVWVHDYSWFCARMSFVTGEGRFCGEAPASLCDPCIARWGRGIDDPVAPSALRTRSAADMRRARAVVVPSADVARRIARHAPGVVPQIVPWERAPLPRPPSVLRSEGVRRVAVVGAIGLEKGFDTLLGCARDAVARALPLEFVVIGYTVDDASLLQTGRVFVTGEFSRGEAEALIRVQSAQLGFLPSVWPETWCYALTDIWSAGLSAAVFDIGTPAGRVRESGAGWVLPLGLPASRINDVLLSLR